MALKRMFELTGHHQFLLVPHANEQEQQDERLRAQAWRRHEHYRVGYSPNQLRSMVPPEFDLVDLSNCFGRSASAFRRELDHLPDEALAGSVDDLFARVREDLDLGLVSEGMCGAGGIAMLTRRVRTS